MLVFKGVTEDGKTITTTYGGGADDIYEFDVGSDKPKKLSDEHWNSIKVEEKDGTVLFESYSW